MHIKKLFPVDLPIPKPQTRLLHASLPWNYTRCRSRGSKLECFCNRQLSFTQIFVNTIKKLISNYKGKYVKKCLQLKYKIIFLYFFEFWIYSKAVRLVLPSGNIVVQVGKKFLCSGRRLCVQFQNQLRPFELPVLFVRLRAQGFWRLFLQILFVL